MKLCAIIPSYNHYKGLNAIVDRLRKFGLPVFIIDDGSAEPARSAIASMHDEPEGVIVHRFDTNQGKGMAVQEGFRLAISAGFTHALQVDADGQHDLEAAPRFITISEANPEAVIIGKPLYDASVPLGRKIGRWITHIWVWIETLSVRIPDSMCGFRVYPLASVKDLMNAERIGSHMDFDTEILVRLFWRGVAPVSQSVKVTYPPDNISNFKMLQDNWRITKMHTRLFLTMLLRLPSILRHRPPSPNLSGRWAMLSERGVYWGLQFCAMAYRVLGRRGCLIVMAPIVFYFYLTAIVRRRASQQFLTRALKRPATFIEGYRHFMNFTMRALDVFIAWTGGIASDALEIMNPKSFAEIDEDPRGGVIVVAHLGNVNLAHALLDRKARERIVILAHTKHAENYNRLLREFRPDAAMNILQVTEIGPETIINLKQRVESGARVVIAGDRTPIARKEHQALVPFLGAEAPFPHGPWVLAALLECPVYLLFCLQDGKRYRLTMERFAEGISLPRATREESLRAYATRDALSLERYAVANPFQWYNFFDFWAHQ